MNGPKVLQFVDGKVNSEVYLQIISDNLDKMPEL